MTGYFTIQFAQEFLYKNFAPWITDLKPKLIECDSGTARIDIPITPHIERVGHMVCGQAISALADTTMVFACFSHMETLIPVATTTLNTEFLRPALGDRLSCIATVEHAGKALFFLTASLVTLPNEKIVAKSTATFYLPPG